MTFACTYTRTRTPARWLARSLATARSPAPALVRQTAPSKPIYSLWSIDPLTQVCTRVLAPVCAPNTGKHVRARRACYTVPYAGEGCSGTVTLPQLRGQIAVRGYRPNSRCKWVIWPRYTHASGVLHIDRCVIMCAYARLVYARLISSQESMVRVKLIVLSVDTETGLYTHIYTQVIA